MFLILVLTVEIVDFEEENEFLVGGLSGELVHCIDELRHGNGSVAVPVEDSERSFHEEGLKNNKIVFLSPLSI